MSSLGATHSSFLVPHSWFGGSEERIVEAGRFLRVAVDGDVGLDQLGQQALQPALVVVQDEPNRTRSFSPLARLPGGHGLLCPYRPLDGVGFRMSAQDLAQPLDLAERLDADGPPATQATRDLLDRSVDQNTPAVHDGNVGAQVGQLGQDVRRDDHCFSHPAKLTYHLAELEPGTRVEARGWLV